MNEQFDALLTLVLPMYNVKDFVVDCLKSIYSQPESKFLEVILVDDGSPDNSAEVAEYWLKQNCHYNNWRIIRQENKGLGGARNTGIDNANSPYIWFIDTDDIITEQALSILLPKLDGSDVIAFCGADMITEDSIVRRYHLNENNVETGCDFMLKCHSVNAQYNIVRKEFLNKYHLRFQEHLIHEDSEFTPRMLYYASSVKETDAILYANRCNPYSITRSIRPGRSFDLLRVSRSLYDFSSKINDKSIRRHFMSASATALNGALSNSQYMDDAMKSEFVDKLSNNLDLIAALRYSKLKYHRMQGLIYSISPKNILKIHFLLIKIFR